ncbi:MAG: hypothetical protein AB1414_04080 [bacterium]
MKLEDLEIRLMDFAFKEGVSQTTEILKRFEDVFSEENIDDNHNTSRNELIECLKKYKKIALGCRPQIIPLLKSIDNILKEITKSSNDACSGRDLIGIARDKCRKLREQMEDDDKKAVNFLLELFERGMICVLDSESKLVNSFLKDPRVDWKSALKIDIPRHVLGYRITKDDFKISSGEKKAIFIEAHTLTEEGWVIVVKGGYTLAYLAQKRNIPFYIVTTFNKVSFCSRELIEEMIETEPIANFYYDFIPPELITKIATEKGIYSPCEIKDVYLKDTSR